MTVQIVKVKKDRSPSYPFVPLGLAVQRLEAFEKYFGRHATPANKVGLAWGMKEQSSQADQTLAALRSFGLVTYSGSGSNREVTVSEEGRTYLRAQQESVKEACLKQAALRPKALRKFWATWGKDRPVDAVALDTLILNNGFSDNGARSFLKVYDDTVSFAKLSADDKVTVVDMDQDGDEGGGDYTPPPPPLPPGHEKGHQVKLMESERVVFTEEGHPRQYLKLIASGEVDDSLLEALEDFVKRQRKRLFTASTLAAEDESKPN